jgi:branched-subunit amino acid ABC-type transport system permease component
VPRYRPLVFATGSIYMVGAPVLYLVVAGAGLPLWWRLYDTIWCLMVGLAFLALCRWSLKHDSEAKPIYSDS